MDLESIVQSEISHQEREIPYDLTHMWNLMNKMNEQNWISPIYSSLIAVSRGRLSDYKKKKKRREKEETHGQGQQSRDCWEKAGWGEMGEYGGINGDGRRLDLGWGTHNTVYRWWVVELCTWNLYNFVNQCHSINVITRKKRKREKIKYNMGQKRN